MRWRAPGRVNLIGEHTDYNDGLALPFAIDAACVAEVGRAASGFVARSAQQSEPVVLAELAGLPHETVPTWARYVLGPALALLRRGYDVPPLEVVVDSAVPLGAGLSSSAAVICSVTCAVVDLLEADLSPDELLALTREVENDVVGAPTGGLDQLASLRSRAGHVLLCDFRDHTAELVPFPLPEAGLALLVVDTGESHSHSEGEYAARRHACASAAAALDVQSLREVTISDLAALPPDLVGITRHVVTENQRTLLTAELLRAGRLRQIGTLLSASHESMREDYRISTPTLDLTVEVLEREGALGARLTGGGFGGSVIALLDDGLVPSVIDAVDATYAERGLPKPRCFTVEPGPGASRL